MERLYIFFIRNDVWIYILCGLGLIWYFGELWRARRALRSAMFGLEQERGQQLQRSALVVIAILLSILGLVLYVNLEVAPTLPPELLKPPTPTPDLFVTPLSSPTGLGPVATPTNPIAPTVTLAGPSNASQLELSGTSSPGSSLTGDAPTPTWTPLVSVGDCSPGVDIISPPSGVEASGAVTFIGTATGERFASYALEAAGPQTNGEWRALWREPVNAPVVNGILGTADMSGWLGGEYAVRLLVTDASGVAIGQCAILLTLSG